MSTMTTPTRDQVIADMQALGVPDLWLATLTDRAFEFIAMAAEHYTTAGREQGLREAKEVCDDHKAGWSENANGCTSGMYDFMSDAAEQCAAAIEQLRGK